MGKTPKAKSKRTNDLSKRLKHLYNEHPFILLLSIFGVTVTAILSSISLYSYGISYYRNSIGWKAVEQSKIDKLVPTTSIEYISSILGTPVLEQKVSETETETIYRSREYWVYLISNSGDKSLKSISLTACEDFQPEIKNNPVGNSIKLGVTKMDQVATNIAATNKDDFQIQHPKPNKYHYHISGATAPSYFFDEYSYGNPSRYQTVYAGVSEVCGDIFDLTREDFEFIDAMNGKSELTIDDVQRLSDIRSRLVVNTVTILAPKIDSEIYGKNIYFTGVPDDIFRTFYTNQITEQRLKSLKDQNKEQGQRLFGR